MPRVPALHIRFSSELHKKFDGFFMSLGLLWLVRGEFVESTKCVIDCVWFVEVVHRTAAPPGDCYLPGSLQAIFLLEFRESSAKLKPLQQLWKAGRVQQPQLPAPG